MTKQLLNLQDVADLMIVVCGFPMAKRCERYFEEPWVVEFREWCTVARDDCACVLFTAPTQLSLPGGIVDSCVWRIRVEKHPDKKRWSMAYAYEVSVTPYFQRNVSGPKFVDVFPTHYPDFVYEMYTDIRKRAKTVDPYIGFAER